LWLKIEKELAYYKICPLKILNLFKYMAILNVSQLVVGPCHQ
jgi:hypothetical protein